MWAVVNFGYSQILCPCFIILFPPFHKNKSTLLILGKLSTLRNFYIKVGALDGVKIYSFLGPEEKYVVQFHIKITYRTNHHEFYSFM